MNEWLPPDCGILGAHPFAIILLGPALRIKLWNPAAERIFQWSRAEALGRTPWELLAPVGQREQMHEELKRLPLGETLSRTFVNQRRDGGSLTCAWHLSRLSAAEAQDILCAVEDVTREALLEERLRYAQKMEALGRLAGGVAHDFNNLLTAINGYSELILEENAEGESLRSHVQEIKRAGEQAAALTRQLLTFSRRHIVKPEALHVNLQLLRLENMLRRLLGEDISLVQKLAPDTGYVLMDPGEFEQALLNLAVNARDAMPAGGILGIETSNQECAASTPRPAGCVSLSITDTGVGLDEKAKARLFEPFFTTKHLGKGLGLSTVYGIVTRAGGSIEVTSAPNEGARFQILLPRVEAEPAPGTSLSEETRIRGGQETIFLVEDDESLRRMTRRILENQGYRVYEAANGMEAIRVLEQVELSEIQLLLTNVVMPEMTGKTLADILQSKNPLLKVMFISGYVDQTIADHLADSDRVVLVQKPFSTQELTYQVRLLLDC